MRHVKRQQGETLLIVKRVSKGVIPNAPITDPASTRPALATGRRLPGFAQQCAVGAARQRSGSFGPDMDFWLATQEEGHGSGFHEMRSRLALLPRRRTPPGVQSAHIGTLVGEFP